MFSEYKQFIYLLKSQGALTIKQSHHFTSLSLRVSKHNNVTIYRLLYVSTSESGMRVTPIQVQAFIFLREYNFLDLLDNLRIIFPHTCLFNFKWKLEGPTE